MARTATLNKRVMIPAYTPPAVKMALNDLSRETGLSRSRLIEQGISLLLEHYLTKKKQDEEESTPAVCGAGGTGTGATAAGSTPPPPKAQESEAAHSADTSTHPDKEGHSSPETAFSREDAPTGQASADDITKQAHAVPWWKDYK
ncbi:hypothetical protein BUE76_04330 [Cnuella takakiae]|nr:hypothetical protein BUE76_04330 [Cnuella takakiae]